MRVEVPTCRTRAAASNRVLATPMAAGAPSAATLVRNVGSRDAATVWHWGEHHTAAANPSQEGRGSSLGSLRISRTFRRAHPRGQQLPASAPRTPAPRTTPNSGGSARRQRPAPARIQSQSLSGSQQESHSTPEPSPSLRRQVFRTVASAPHLSQRTSPERACRVQLLSRDPSPPLQGEESEPVGAVSPQRREAAAPAPPLPVGRVEEAMLLPLKNLG